MKKSIMALFLSLMLLIGGIAAADICTPAVSASVPLTIDGTGTYCYVVTSLCGYINSWNLATLEINGTSYLNTYVSSSSIPAASTYNIHYVSTVSWGHFEISGTCSGGATATRTATSAATATTARTATRTTTSAGTATRTPTSGRTATRTATSTSSRTSTMTATTTRTATSTIIPTRTSTSTTTGQTAAQIVSQLKVGWNLGNTLEAICGETAWGVPMTTQTLINAVKAAGFNTIRLPVAWDCHSVNNTIDAAWMARVKTVVDYCMNAGLYIILNIHWDNGWLENNVTTSAQAAVNIKQQAYWTQIANAFISYNDHLLFASANEPNVSDATGMTVLLSYHQTFINAVRATGGNNSSRVLVIQGPSTDIDTTNNLMNTMPTDTIANRLIVEVHYYTPWNFCGLTADADWGVMFYYWGTGYHSTVEPNRNATWGEESDVEKYLGYMKTKFVDKGIPVIIGEFGAMKRTSPAELALHISSRNYYHKTIVSSAKAKGIVCYYWDNGYSESQIFDRNTGSVIDQGTLTALMTGAGS